MSNKKTWYDIFGKLKNDEWKNMTNKAQEIWEGLNDVQKNENYPYENEKCPMHPNIFFQLSSVSGFNDINGWYYSDYVQKWRQKTT